MSNFKKRLFSSIILVAIIVPSVIFYDAVAFRALSFFLMFGILVDIVAKGFTRDHGLQMLANKYGGFYFLSAIVVIFVVAIGTQTFCDVTPYEIGLILVVACTYDTFSYLVGAPIGGKIIKVRPFPDKSWEGVIGGIAASYLLGFTYLHLIQQAYSAPMILVILAGGIVACLSDLFVSLVKKLARTKSMGNNFSEWLLPGHKGFLNRFLSWFSVACIYYLITLFF